MPPAMTFRTKMWHPNIYPDGKVCIYTKAETDIIADVNSVVPEDGSPFPVLPARLVDSRSGPEDKTADGQSQGFGRVAAGGRGSPRARGREGEPAARCMCAWCM